MSWRNSVVGWLVVAFVATGVLAEDPPNDLTNLSLEQLMNVQFYTASRRSQNLADTPASVTVVTADDIRTFGYRTLADVLQSVRGYWVNSDRNYSYVGVRGFARPGDYNTRILLLINGHRLNDNIYDQGLIGSEFPLDLDLVDRIEIVRGPASSLYGTNAFLGVVNVITSQPLLKTNVRVAAEADSGFYRRANVSVSLPEFLDGGLFSATLAKADGAEQYYFPEFDTPATNNGIARDVDADRSQTAFALVNWHEFQIQALAGTRMKIIPTGSFHTVLGDPRNRTVDSRGYLDVSYKRDFASGLQLTARAFYDAYAYRGTYAYADGDSSSLDRDYARGDWIGTEIDISKSIGARHVITAGTEVRYNLRQNQQLYSGPDLLLDDYRTSSVFAAFFEEEVKLSSKLSINGGVRLDRYSTFGVAVSPRIAAIVRPDSKTTLKYSFGHAFRAPNAYEMYYADQVSFEANPLLKPEKIISHNVSFERIVTSNVRATVEAFHSSLSGLIDQGYDPQTDRYYFLNINAASSKGLEFGVVLQHGSLRSEVSYTLSQSTDRWMDATLANSPHHIAKARLQAPLFRLIRAGIEMQYVGLQDRLPGALNTNGTISTSKPIFGFDITASCYNALDRTNFYPVPPALTQTRLQQDSRGYRITIARSWSRD